MAKWGGRAFQSQDWDLPREGQPTVVSRLLGTTVVTEAPMDAVARSLGTVHLGRNYDWNPARLEGDRENEWAFRFTALGDSGDLRIWAAVQASGIVRGKQGGSIVEVRYAPTFWSMVSIVASIALAIWGGSVVTATPAAGIVALLVAVAMLFLLVGLLREAQLEIEASIVRACAEPRVGD